MSENYLAKMLVNRTKELPRMKAMRIQDDAIKLFRKKQKLQLSKFLEESGCFDTEMQTFIDLSFFKPNALSMENRTSREETLDEMLFEAIAKQFETDKESVLRKLVVLPDSEVGITTCQIVGRAIFNDQFERGKIVLPFILPENKEWREVPLSHGYTFNSRGLGVADMAYALGSGRKHRASGSLTYHVLEAMHAFHTASDEEKTVSLKSTVDKPAPLPLGLEKGYLDP